MCEMPGLCQETGASSAGCGAGCWDQAGWRRPTELQRPQRPALALGPGRCCGSALCPLSSERRPSSTGRGSDRNHGVCRGCRRQLPSPILLPAPCRLLEDLAAPVLGSLQGPLEPSPSMARASLFLRHTLWGSCQAGRGPREARGARAWRSVSLCQWLPGSVRQVLDALTAESTSMGQGHRSVAPDARDRV